MYFLEVFSHTYIHLFFSFSSKWFLVITAPPTHTNFWLTFLLIGLQEALYEDLSVLSIKFEVYHYFSGLKFVAEVNVWHPFKNVVSCDVFIIR